MSTGRIGKAVKGIRNLIRKQAPMKVVTMAAIGSALVGGSTSGAFASPFQSTQTMDLCRSGHERQSTTHIGYKDTIHYKSGSGEKRAPLRKERQNHEC